MARLTGADGTVQRLEFLVEVGEVLASSLDLDQTLQQIARLTLPVLGDFCTVDLMEGGQLRRVAAAHLMPSKAEILANLRRAYPPLPDSEEPASRVMRSGRVEVLNRVAPEGVADCTTDQAHARLAMTLGTRAHLAVPLLVRGQALGVLGFGVTESIRSYGPQDLSLAEDVARRAAHAVDHARLFHFAHAELAERRRAQDALRISEERFRAIFEQSPLSMQILAPGGTTARVNAAWEKLWGLTLDQLAGYDMLQDHQLETLGIAPLIRRAFGGEAVHLPAIRYDPDETIPDGSRNADPARWVSAFAYPVTDASGAVREVVLVHQDVTESRRHQEALKASEETLRLALDSSRMNVWDWDLRMDTVVCSANARAFWGVDVSRPDDFLAVIHPDDLDRCQEETRSAVRGPRAYECEFRLVAEGRETRWVQSRGRVDRTADGLAIRMLGVSVDITELKRAEENTRLLADAGAVLGTSLDYHATLSQLSRLLVPRFADGCAIDLIGPSGDLDRVAVHHSNPAFVTFAREVFERYPPRRHDRRGTWHVMETREPHWLPEITDGVLQQVARDPEHLAILRGLNMRSVITVPLVARNAAIGVLTLVHAESGRRYHEADVQLSLDLARRAAAAVDNAQLFQQLQVEDRRKDEFLATLAHELRNPLAPIRTGLALLKVTTDVHAAQRTRDVMDRQLGHMVRLIDDLLDLSRVTRGAVPLERKWVDLQTVVGTAVEASRPLLDAAGLHVTVAMPEEAIVLEVDGTRISQALSNLLNNASKFTGRGGRVDLAAVDEGTSVLISVRDTGIGIPAGKLDAIFDMFVQGDTTSRVGLGIGLTLVRRLVELHGGMVWAESGGLGQGSAFLVRLAKGAPAGQRPDTKAIPALSTARPAAARRVLLVDDNVDATNMLASLLVLEGHDVRTAPNGFEALRIAADFRPHVGFLDIGLPGMSGYELAGRLRADPDMDGLVLIALTGWGQVEDRRRSREAGFNEHLTKPVDPAVVLSILARE